MKKIKEAALWCRPKLKARQWEYIASLPITEALKCGKEGNSDGGLITFCHGSPSSFSEGILPENSPGELDILLRDMPEDSEVLVCGHTHTRFMMNYRHDCNTVFR